MPRCEPHADTTQYHLVVTNTTSYDVHNPSSNGNQRQGEFGSINVKGNSRVGLSFCFVREDTHDEEAVDSLTATFYVR